MIKQTNLIFRRARNSKSYQCSLSQIGYSRKIITIKYDPGSCSTIITANLLGFDETNIAKLKDLIKSRKLPKTMFKTANDSKVYGYPVEVTNVKLGSLEIPAFRYYIIPTTSYIKALLGNDFLDYCELYKPVLSEVHAREFDYDLYRQSLDIKSDKLCQDDLDSLL